MKKSLIALSIAASFAATGVQAVVLPAGATLSIDAGSSFDMGSGANAIIGFNGLTVGPGAGNTGGGSHGGAPNGTVGAVTGEWLFFCNTGYDYMALGTSFGGSTEAGVDMSGWIVTWNNIETIPMGGCQFGDPANNGGFSACDQNQDGVDELVNTGIGIFTWDGTNGGAYTIEHSANVPAGDPSGFGGTLYTLSLQGTVSTVPVPAAVWLFGSGLLGLVGVARRRKAA